MNTKNLIIFLSIFFGLGVFYYLSTSSEALNIVSATFVILVPFIIGVVAGMIGAKLSFPNFRKRSLVALVLLCVLVEVLLLVISGKEAFLCIIVALPFIVLMPWFGVLFGWWIYNKCAGRRIEKLLIFLIFLPFAAQQVENQWEAPVAWEVVENSIELPYPMSSKLIWSKIVSVDPIRLNTIPNKWIYKIGFPKPVSAVIDKHQVGGVRTAIFEKGVSFHEVVTEWNPPYKLVFSIEADPEFIPASAFDRHIVIGGRLFDVVEGGYEIVEYSEKTVLKLTSRHRISTWFNFYTRLWSRSIMESIQESILTVLKKRIEKDYLLSKLEKAR